MHTEPSAGPGWWRTAVIYQVYVCSLGVDGLWLNPFYPSPQHDHGYDVSDYCAVHPDYGTIDTFDRYGELPPNNWRSIFGGSAWQRVPDGQWYLHTFAAEQADFNWRDPDVATYFEQVLRFWFDVNCSSKPVCTPVDGELVIASDPEVGEKLPPDSAGWFLLRNH